MTANRGIPFLAVDWTLLIPALIAFSIRLYSRTFLTRSLGSDDFAICFPIVLTTIGSTLNILEVRNGLGTHRSTLSAAEYAEDQKWEYIAWLHVFISFFFVRVSVMLFVLRLLPPFKRWQQKVIYVAFILNIIITIIATVSYGVSCIPFRAWWQNVSGAKCASKNVLVATQKTNGGLACAIDIIVALVPAFLLWNVQMRRRTKFVLNVIFALGLLTAAMSIGRAAAISHRDITTDTTWLLMPNKWFGMVEEKCGIIFACGPAVRQFFAYRARTGTFRPSAQLQPPNDDFTKMRRRITLRDMFWVRRSAPADTPQAQGQKSSKKQKDLSADVEATAKTSVLDTWWGRFWHAIPGTSYSSNSTFNTGALKVNRRPLTDSAAEKGRIEGNYKRWGLLPRRLQASNTSDTTPGPFLLTDTGTSATETGQRSEHEQDASLREVLADPVTSLVSADQRMTGIEMTNIPTSPRHDSGTNDGSTPVSSATRV